MSALATEQGRFRDSVPLPKLAERSPFSFRSGSVTSVFIVIVSLAFLRFARSFPVRSAANFLTRPDKPARPGLQARSLTMASGTAAPAGAGTGLRILAEHADLSWMNFLTPDPETEKHAPNKRSREVKSGHYVPVLPSPLPSPKLLITSPSMAAELGLDEAALASDEFLR